MTSPHKRTLRKSLRSALSHKKLADELLDSLADSQAKFNTTMTKLDADDPAIAAVATWDITTDIILTSVATGVARNTETITLQVIAPAANPTDTLLAAWSGTTAAMVLTITPNDGTNNGATPVTFTTAELVEYINTGDIAAKTGQVTESGSTAFRDDQTATGGDATPLADAGEGDAVVATFASGAANGAVSIDYEATGAVTDLFAPDAIGTGAQHKATLRKSLRSALSHKKLADEIVDAIEELQVGYNAMLVKLDAEAGTLNDTNYSSTLILTAVASDAVGTDAQHKAAFRKSLKSALVHSRLADQILDAITATQASFNATLVLLDAGTIGGTEHVANQVTAINPDAT